MQTCQLQSDVGDELVDTWISASLGCWASGKPGQMQRDAVSHELQVRRIGVCSPHSKRAEAILSDPAWGALKHTFRPKGVVRFVCAGCNGTGRAPEGAG